MMIFTNSVRTPATGPKAKPHINTGNSLEQLAGVIPEAVINEEEGLMDLRWVADGNEKMQLLMDSLILGLTGIMKQYGKTYIDLAFKEV